MTVGTETSGDASTGPLPYYRKDHWGDDGRYTVNSDGTHTPRRNEYSMDLTVGSYVNGVKPGSNFLPCSMSPVWDPRTIPPNFDLKLVSRLSEKIKGSSINLGNDFVTGQQTLDMCLSTVKRLTASARDLRKGNIPSALRRLGVSPPKRGLLSHSSKPLTSKDASGLWLEMQYGWRPLLSDVYDIASVYELATAGPRTFEVNVASSTNWKERVFTPGNIGTFNACSYHRKIIWHGYEVLSVPRAMGLDDPLSMAWEVLPWSFVADWFIPIGTYLDALHQTPNFSGWYENITKKVSDSVVWDDRAYSATYGANTSVERVEFRRLHLTSLSVPQPEFKTWRSALGPEHLANALALLTQVITK